MSGILRDGKQIAVKRLSKSSKQGANEFKNEVLLIAKLQHRNLVALQTHTSIHLITHSLWISQHTSNSHFSLKHVGSKWAKCLSWFDHYNIIEGIVWQIHYLHKHSWLKVIHRNLKHNNVLLDENMIQKTSDFGLARIVEINQDQEITNRIVGT